MNMAYSDPLKRIKACFARMNGEILLKAANHMEGVIPNNLMQIEPEGFTLIPPDPFGNLQRLFLPRTALTSVAVLGVIGSPLHRRKRAAKPVPKEQYGLFDE